MSARFFPPHSSREKSFLFSITRLCFICLAVLFLVPQGVRAAQVAVAWDPSTSTSVSGYKLYFGNASRTYSATYDAGGNTSYVVSGIDGSQSIYLAATAYDSTGNESDYSTELTCQTLVASSGTNGSISPSGTMVVANGDSRTFTITPSSGYAVSDVKVDGVSQGAITSYTFSSVSAPHTISATFAPQKISFAIVASAGSNGSITPSGTTLVESGASQAYTISPSAGYKIADVKVDGVSQGAIASYTFSSVSAAHTISATFAPVLWTISTSVTGSGTITPSGTFTVSQGSSQTFTMIPQNSSGVVDLKVDGVSQGAVSSYTLSNITANHTIVAVFGSPVRIVPDVASISPGDLANRGVNVKLSDKPASTVTVSVSWLELDSGETSQTDTVLTFSPGTWNTAQCVKLSSRPDFADGDHNTVLHFGAAGLIPGDVAIEAASMQVEPIHVLSAANSTPPQIAVLKADSRSGVNEVSIKGSKSGLAVGTVTFDTTSVPNGLGVASVQGSNSLVELLIDPLGGGANVEIRDANTNAQVNSISLDMQYAPKRLAVLPDLNGDGVSEVAVAGVDASTSAVWVQILDPLTGAVIRNISYAGGRVPKFLVIIPSININGDPGIALLSRVKATDCVMVQTCNANTGESVADVSFGTGFHAMGLGVLAGIPSRNTAELAVVGVTTANAAVMYVRNALTGVQVNRNSALGTVGYLVGVKVVPDVNGNGVPEVALLGLSSSGVPSVKMLDAHSGLAVGTVKMTKIANPVGFALVPDLNGSQYSEVAVLGTDKKTASSAVEIRDFKSGSLVNYIYY